jgi:hypothetical protein
MPPLERLEVRSIDVNNSILLMRVCAYVWASPYTVVGLALGGLAAALGARWRWTDGAVEVAGGLAGRWLARRRVPFAALTLGHVVLAVDARSLAALRAHEREHVRQYERWGALFGPAYLLSSLWQGLRGADPYRSNRFERQAYAVAGWQGDGGPAAQEHTPDA